MPDAQPATQEPQSLNTAPLKRFAQAARRQLIEVVTAKLDRVLAEGSSARRELPKAVAELESQIKASSRGQVIERVAYTWFNRFCALRFMDANRYTRIGIVSPAEGFTQPEILADAKQGVIDDELRVNREKVLGLLDGTQPSSDPQGEAYQLLLVAVCNSYAPRTIHRYSILMGRPRRANATVRRIQQSSLHRRIWTSGRCCRGS